MKISSTEIQNNFGKYLTLAAQEEIIVTRNGTPIAKLAALKEPVDQKLAAPFMVMESVEPYQYEGRKATYEEFLELTRDNEERYEYIDGEIFLLASPRAAHQYALRELLIKFYNWSKGKSCEPWTAPFDIRLYRSVDKPNVIQPDIMMICDFDEHLDDNDCYQGVPALVVEIISESTKRNDLVKKLDLYMSCGVKEYWIVDPSSKDILIYLFDDGNISRKAFFKLGETAASFLFEGLSVVVDQVFR